MSLCELTRTAIQDLIPHRDPFLFLESARVESEKEISGLAVWSKAHPILQGHFPQRPIVPGVCLIEAGAQLTGVLLRWQGQNLRDSQNGLGVLASVQNAKFKRGLAPDELLRIDCRVRALSPHAFVVHCTGSLHTNGAIVFENEMLLARQFDPT